MNSNKNLLISRHLALITHDVTMSVNSPISVYYGNYIRISQPQCIIFRKIFTLQPWSSTIGVERRPCFMYKPSAIEMKFGPGLLESRVADSYNLLSTLVILDIDQKQKK